ncbi:MAG: SDR family oxidoreductase [Gammaproteobacteria bacterium]|jgi:3(or 17)beta-hydroxysteroid dehydrogenase|nr:SDR family oxidoreductase [Gammaproteobacteria bacterium]
MSRVKDKVIIVTGAASGLGLADATVLAREGARVIMTDINGDAGVNCANEIGATFITQDVSEEGSWSAVMAQVERDFGRLDGLVNNAGVAPIASIEDTTTEMWRQVLSIHLDATFWGCQSAIQLMKKSGGGSIVNMSSTAALIGLGPYLAYSAAKGGIRAMTKSIAIHCRQAGLNIRCNSVHPGSISTPMVHTALKTLMGTDLLAEEDPEATRKALGIGEPEDVANMVLYLLSDESKHVTGAEMVIDNGDTVI